MANDTPTVTADHLRALDTTPDALLILDQGEVKVLPRGDAEGPLAQGATLVFTPEALRPVLTDVGGDVEEAARRSTWELGRMLAEGDAASSRPS